MSEPVEKILAKHLLRYFRLSSTSFTGEADKEKLSKWLSKKLVGDGWLCVTPEIRRQTLHSLHLDTKFLGGKVTKETSNILPKNSIIAILENGDSSEKTQENPRPNFEGM